MKKRELSSKNNCQKSADKMKKIGSIFLLIGVICLLSGSIISVLGFAGFNNQVVDTVEKISTTANNISNHTKIFFGKSSLIIIGGGITSLGIPMLIIGAIMKIIAHKKELDAFNLEHTMPLRQEYIEKIKNTEITKTEKTSKNK